MSDNKIVTLSGDTSVRSGEPCQDAIKGLEHLLEMARSGELQGYVASFANRDGSASYSFGGRIGGYGMLGALDVVKSELVDINRGDE